MSADPHFDVLIVGAGLSGVGAAWRLRRQRPSDAYVILEARTAIGGTWDLFRYPGVRSDSDMFTLSYPFRPWREPEALASGDKIRRYIEDTAVEAGITRHIRFGARVVRADWSTPDARWTVRTADGQVYTCTFLYSCAGYYSYTEGYQPDFPGLGTFRGRLVHPQFWPEDLDHRGKRVVVIGSGATAVTLVPAMASDAAHVTMLQRSPSYVTPLPDRDVLADLARRALPAGAANRVARAKNILLTQAFYQVARRRPRWVRRALRGVAINYLQNQAYVDEHFKPAYDPWDQRLCVIPGGDLYTAITSGRASVVTDHIDTFVPEGIRLASGAVLPADVVVSATGLSLLPVGGIELVVDGTPVELGQKAAYRGLMLSGVPNLAYCIGYVNASWTLRADLSHRYVIRLLDHLERHRYASATPTTPAAAGRPLLDLSSGYVRRALDKFPVQGDRDPWLVRQNYLRDVVAIPRADVTRDMTFTRRTAPQPDAHAAHHSAQPDAHAAQRSAQPDIHAAHHSAQPDAHAAQRSAQPDIHAKHHSAQPDAHAAQRSAQPDIHAAHHSAAPGRGGSMRLPEYRFAGNTAVLTGAASGIGEQLAHGLAGRGSGLVLVDVDEARLAPAADRIRLAHPGLAVQTIVADLADRSAVESVAAQVLSDHPAIGLLINNAGIALGGRFDQVSVDQFETVMNVNFRAPMLLTHALIPALTAVPGGHLVNMSSLFGLIAPPGQSAYSASKFALRGLSESLRGELLENGVGVTTVHPGGIRTRIAESALVGTGVPADQVEPHRKLFAALLSYPADKAADQILRAVAKRRARLLIAASAKTPDVLARLLPVGHARIVRALTAARGSSATKAVARR